MVLRNKINEMKIKLLLIPIIVSSTCSSQEMRFQPGCWMPEKYINGLKENPFKNYSDFLKPIESFVINDDSIFIKTYGGELSLGRTKNISANRIELTNIAGLFNLKYFSKHEVLDKKFFLSEQDNFIVLEIEKGSEIQDVLFVNNIDGYYFKNSDDPFSRLALKGTYSFEKGLTGKILISLDGKIKESEQWNSYDFLRYYAKDDGGDSYKLLILHGDNNTESKFAVQIGKHELLLYNYSTEEKSDFYIKVSDKPKYVLKRITQ
jgi:hypothetical protein